MSTPSQLINLSTLKFITPQTLATHLRASPSTSTSTTTTSTISSESQPAQPTTAIIDVRDNDHLGGHIRTSQWIPITQLDARMPEILRVNASKDRVVFHCMLSQQRGPKAALAYARARAEKASKEAKEKGDGETKVVDEKGRIGGQEICVLQGGFEGWMLAGLAEDEGLTEGYVKELWE